MPKIESLVNLLQKYFPERANRDEVMAQFETAFHAYIEWNEKVNLISRKDVENLAERHFLHSLGIAKHIQFKPGTRVLDVGTGGGFPGIPLAILFPETEFLLVDSIAKKIKVVENIVQVCGLKNVQYSVRRAAEVEGQFDFVVSRAVTRLNKFLPWIKGKGKPKSVHDLQNGILYLKGGDLEEEIGEITKLGYTCNQFPLSPPYEEEFFESKYLLHIPFYK